MNDFDRAGLEAEQLFVEPGRVRLGAERDRDVLVAVDFAVRVLPVEVDGHRVALDDAAPFDRLELRRPVAQPRQRIRHGLVVDGDPRTAQRDRGEDRPAQRPAPCRTTR